MALIQPVISFHDGAQVKSHLKRTDSAFWEIIEADFLEGRPYSADDVERAQPVAVINEATRHSFFGTESALGQSLEIAGQSFRIVGVIANVPAFRLASFADVWVPVTTIPDPKALGYNSITGGYEALILAETAADIPRIKAEFEYVLTQVEFPDPERFNRVTGGADTLFEMISRFAFSDDMTESHPERLLAIILVLAVLFMILPAISLININVSRIMERASEIGVRKSFGAASTTLVGQFVVENVLLTLAGGLLGFGLTELVLYLLSSSYLIPYAEFHVNYRIFAYGLLMALFFGVFAGVYPAWKMSRLHPVEALRRKVR
jgi:putative ABC transport system permease protein